MVDRGELHYVAKRICGVWQVTLVVDGDIVRSTVGITFFYFTFNDESKQEVSGILRALLLQLSSQLREASNTDKYSASISD